MKEQPPKTQAEALSALQALHKEYVRKCGSRFAKTRFSANAVPGWTYDPTTGTVTAQS